MYERGLSQAEIAKMVRDRCGSSTSQQAISKVLLMACGPVVFDQLCTTFGVTREQVLDRLKRGEYKEHFARRDLEVARQARASGEAIDLLRELPEERHKALDEEDWSGASPEEYEFVHKSLLSYNFASGLEPVLGYWRSRVSALRAEFRGRAVRDVVEGDPSSPDPRVEAEKARRKARRRE